ncbi:hypothetical protein NM208_g4275 [Fusarium decemcellulare]|uniref:Uncharacterized protein n=1 Tax=Fusarium decemcellulare TaxID=57161 RepID=A0ACC1SLM2_9HYPO|nr:hypothetical protein NM208_g4275 [Fusarium decemcellulare]
MMADDLTKGLPRLAYESFRHQLNMTDKKELLEANRRRELSEDETKLEELIIKDETTLTYSDFRISLGFYGSNGVKQYSDEILLFKTSGLYSDHRNKLNDPATQDKTIHEQVKHWLEHCQNNHPTCSEDADDAWLPTRLIYVGSGDGADRVKLIHTHQLASTELPAQYVALSHMWGTAKFVTLESSNLNRFQNEIPLMSLRRTFVDAVNVARELGVHYIWIDSLCIIQDSEEDWRKESKTMALVYANAVCTLAAAEAEGLEDGLLNVRRLATKLEFPQSLMLLGEPQTFEFRYEPRDFYTMRLATAPLRRRGWVLQETLLSRRTIYFGSPLIWECRGGLCGAGYAGEVPYQYPLLTQRKLWPSLLKPDDNYLRQWARIVATFSRTSLTKSRDKLVAISGIARTLAPNMQSEYVAGLWREPLASSRLPVSGDLLLASCLLWASGDQRLRDSKPPLISSVHCKSYRAPSWSWASVDGPIDWRYPVVADQNCELEIKEVYVKALGGDSFGPIEDAFLDVSAKLFTLGPYRSVRDGLWNARSRKPDVKWMVLDGEIAEDENLFLLLVMTSAQGAFGLVLNSTGRKNHLRIFKRIGFARVDYVTGGLGNSDWKVPGWESWFPRETIRLV